MKSWLELENWYLPFIVFVVILSVGLLPTVEFDGQYYGGGVVREWTLNHVFLVVTPFEFRHALLAWWQQAAYREEVALYGLFTVNAFVAMLPLLYGLMKLKIELYNWHTLSVFESKQQRLKGK